MSETTEYEVLVTKLTVNFDRDLTSYFAEYDQLRGSNGYPMELIRFRATLLNEKIQRLKDDHAKRLEDIYMAEARRVVQLFMRKEEDGLLENIDEILALIHADEKMLKVYKEGQL